MYLQITLLTARMCVYINPIITSHTHTHSPVPTSQAQFRYVKAMDNLEKFIDINYRRKERKKNNFHRGIEIRLCVSRY